MTFHVVLVEPQFPGNVGHVARSMLNFGVTNLHLVNPCPMTEEGRDRAVHAQSVLQNAKLYDTFDEVRRRMDYCAAFTARVSASDRSHLRVPVSLPEFAPRLQEIDGDVALVFGREDFGLSNEDVEVCDASVFIPTSPMYLSMNLSHAVTTALYELHRTQFKTPYTKLASSEEKELLFATVDHLTESLGYQPHRRKITNLMFRKFVGRAVMTRWEFHRIMGLFTNPLKRMGKWPPPHLPTQQVREAEAHEDDEPPLEWSGRTNPPKGPRPPREES